MSRAGAKRVAEVAVVCHGCGRSEPFDGPVPRAAACDGCSADLRVCLNCTHYDRGSYNDCREPSAERVVEKDKSNFCDYFRPRETPRAGDAAGGKLDGLEKLFK
jgi:hypothetical protein